MKSFKTGERVKSLSSGKKGEVIRQSKDDDYVRVKFDDRTHGELPGAMVKKLAK